MKGNIVSILRDRELNNKIAPNFLTSKIVRRLIHSDKELYSTKWSKKSKNPIFYQNEMLFFDIYKDYISVSSIKRNCIESPAICSVEGRPRINDAIVYSGLKNIEKVCQCELNCICFSQCLFLIAESNTLDIHLLANGRIVRRIYLGDDIVEYRDCDWVTPNERFSLIGYECPIDIDMNEILYLMVFTVPLELQVLLEIKKMVFPDVECVKLIKNLLIVENSARDYFIYRFDEFIKQGKCDICIF